MNPEADHQEALAQLDRGQPLKALRLWRQLLLRDPEAVAAHQQAAEHTLHQDPLALPRRQALALIARLQAAEPGEPEQVALGQLLRSWGDLCCSEAPDRALQHWERAWACGNDLPLARQLAGLYRRLGLVQGAAVLEGRSPPPPAGPGHHGEPLQPWPQSPCAAQGCLPCQQAPAPADPPLQVWELPGGRCWLQRHSNPWHYSHGLAVQTAAGAYVEPLCRRYPWPWPACRHWALHRPQALADLAWRETQLSPAHHHSGPVLAVAELSGEQFFHWSLELLPRIGRCWPELRRTWPTLKLWHNGGHSPWVGEALARMHIDPADVIDAQRWPHLRADLLLVPGFLSEFGCPSQANLTWLDQFWATPAAPAKGPLLLARPGALRRPVLGLPHHVSPWPLGNVQQQWQAVAAADAILAPHGAAMATLLAAQPGTPLLELVNPAYQPPYFAPVIQHRALRHRRLQAATTPWPLQELLYEGPLAFPIDLRPGCSPAAEALQPWLARSVDA